LTSRLKKQKLPIFFNTVIIGELSQPGVSLYSFEHSNNGLITFPGGIPIKNAQSEVIRAISVSGSSVENDQAITGTGVVAIQ